SSRQASHVAANVMASPRTQITCRSVPSSSGRRGEFGELSEALQERELDHARRPVAVLREVDLGQPLLVGLLVVVLVAVDEHDEIGVLLYRIMGNNIVGNKAVKIVDSQVVDLVLAVRLDCRDLVPIDIARRKVG